MWLTDRGAYVFVYQVIVDNRVRRNAHTIIGNGLSIKTISATAPFLAALGQEPERCCNVRF